MKLKQVHEQKFVQCKKGKFVYFINKFCFNSL